MTPEEKKQYITILLQTMKDFDAFCIKNDLKYFACGGTAIGAVRHQGMIPWDDDIDVYMPREDYDKLLTMRDQLSSTIYELEDLTTPGYTFPFAKFMNKNSSILEYREHKIVLGIYIDIFPLDSVPNDLNVIRDINDPYKFLFDNYTRSMVRPSIHQYRDYLKTKSPKENLSLIWDIVYHRRKFNQYYNQIINFQNNLKSLDGEYYYSFGFSLTTPNDLFKKSWFDDYIMMPFDNIELRMPIGYHEFLTTQFGNYMTPPPLNKQISHHPQYYVDLEKRLTRCEIISAIEDK